MTSRKNGEDEKGFYEKKMFLADKSLLCSNREKFVSFHLKQNQRLSR